MSKPDRKTLPRIEGPDGAVPSGPLTLTGVVKTTKGYAVALVELSPSGAVLSATLRGSQTFPEHVAREHQRIAVNETLKVQAR
jgi:hypothetical protein